MTRQGRVTVAKSDEPLQTSISDNDLLKLINSRFGTKVAVMYYLRKAKDAAARAKIELQQQNPHKLGAEAQTMITNVEMIWKILGDDSKQL